MDLIINAPWKLKCFFLYVCVCVCVHSHKCVHVSEHTCLCSVVVGVWGCLLICMGRETSHTHAHTHTHTRPWCVYTCLFSDRCALNWACQESWAIGKEGDVSPPFLSKGALEDSAFRCADWQKADVVKCSGSWDLKWLDVLCPSPRSPFSLLDPLPALPPSWSHCAPPTHPRLLCCGLSTLHQMDGFCTGLCFSFTFRALSCCLWDTPWVSRGSRLRNTPIYLPKSGKET